MSNILLSLAAQFLISDKGQKLVKVERKAPADKAPKAPKASKSEAPAIVAPSVIAKGNMTAAQFQVAARDAGKRTKCNDAGVEVSYIDPSLVRSDEILAIAAFVGYDYREPHGVQLDCAKRAALVALRPVAAMPEGRSVHGATASVGGFIAGMPDAQRKIVQDLLARERMLSSEWIDLCKLPAEEIVEREIGAEKYRAPAGKLADLAKAALDGIREDLAPYRKPCPAPTLGEIAAAHDASH